MPSNEIVINGSIKQEVPDSWMPPLMAYLKMVKEKIEPAEEIKDFGDIYVKIRKDLGGFEIWSKPNPDETKDRRLCFFNENGMADLAKWISKVK